MNPFEFITANKVICEVGAAHKLAQYCQELEISRLMLVTDSGIVQTGMADPLVAEIEKAGISVFLYSDVQADPPESLVLASVEVAKSEKIDGVVGLGVVAQWMSRN